MYQGTPDNTVTDWQYQDMSPGTLDAYEESSSAKIQIGISSGASAPEVLVENFIKDLKKKYSLKIEEVEIIKEEVTFKIPGKLN